MKKIVRLNESELNTLLTTIVKETLNEGWFRNNFIGRSFKQQQTPQQFVTNTIKEIGGIEIVQVKNFIDSTKNRRNGTVGKTAFILAPMPEDRRLKYNGKPLFGNLQTRNANVMDYRYFNQQIQKLINTLKRNTNNFKVENTQSLKNGNYFYLLVSNGMSDYGEELDINQLTANVINPPSNSEPNDNNSNDSQMPDQQITISLTIHQITTLLT